MRIRSVTCFVNIDDPAGQADAVRDAGLLAADARQALEAAGFPVQTTRLATQPMSMLPIQPLELATELWPVCLQAGFDYLSLGPVIGGGPDADLSYLDLIPELIRSTEAVFASVLAADGAWGINFEAVRRTAGLVRDIAHSTEEGFGNLRLAMLANTGPHAPFFPAAYHDGGPPAIALATESADLAVDAFTNAESVDKARDRLVGMVEDSAGLIADAIGPLAEAHGFRFPGIDFSLAPFPEEARSIGAAVERLGVDRFGAPGTLFVVSLLTECLREAVYPHTGFSGVMLPVLEDAVLAERSLEAMFTVNDLLLYSAVCGTGLDTVPLPGDAAEEELAGILLDVAALAVRLDKPLTARLMPVPGLSAGDVTEFEFEYFGNGRVLGVKGQGSTGLFGGPNVTG